jgi:hypothetical protein
MYNYAQSWVSEDNVLMMLQRVALKSFGGIVVVALAAVLYTSSQTKAGPVDPGVRGGPTKSYHLVGKIDTHNPLHRV